MIHQYKSGGMNIVLDVCSGSVHAVDDVTYDMIAAYEDINNETKETTKETVFNELNSKYGTDMEEIKEIYDEITELKDAGKLFV